MACDPPDANDKVKRYDVVYDLLQYCIIPRAKLSLPDAVYANAFVRKMHSMNTPGFQLVIFYDRVRLSPLCRAMLCLLISGFVSFSPKDSLDRCCT